MTASSLSELKRNRKQSFAETQEQIKKYNKNDSFRDPRFWTPTFDKSQRAQALIRFLPKPKGEPSAVIRVYNHWFKGPNGWYKENSLTTLGMNDPAQDLTKRLYEIGSDKAKEKARTYGRKKKFISNIFVKKDPMNPQSEGKVFLYEYPQAIYDLLDKAMTGGEKDDKLGIADEIETFDVFSFWESKDFKLDVGKKGTFNNYENCSFVGKLSDLFKDDDHIDQVWAQQHSLQEFLDEKKYKTYDELKANLFNVLGVKSMDEAVEYAMGGTTSSSRSLDDEMREEEEETVRERKPRARSNDDDEDERPSQRRAAARDAEDERPARKAAPATSSDDDDEDDESYLDALLQDETPKKRGR